MATIDLSAKRVRNDDVVTLKPARYRIFLPEFVLHLLVPADTEASHAISITHPDSDRTSYPSFVMRWIYWQFRHTNDATAENRYSQVEYQDKDGNVMAQGQSANNQTASKTFTTVGTLHQPAKGVAGIYDLVALQTPPPDNIAIIKNTIGVAQAGDAFVVSNNETHGIFRAKLEYYTVYVDGNEYKLPPGEYCMFIHGSVKFDFTDIEAVYDLGYSIPHLGNRSGCINILPQCPKGG